MDQIRLLENPIQPYAWGSRTALAKLQNRPSPAPGPEAELWIGAHPTAPSRIRTDEGTRPLDAWIAQDPAGILGAEVARRFGGELPFLLKVLAVAEPLSLQAHPGADAARVGFQSETARGVPLDARERCFRDPHAKVEMACALERFETFAGFRKPVEILERFDALGVEALEPVLAPLRAGVDAGGWREAFESLLGLSGPRARDALAAAASAAAASDDRGLGWLPRLADAWPEDGAALAPVYLQHHLLGPGAAVPVSAGVLHAHLEGLAVEVMTASDNVLRAGLTAKHVDRRGLLAILDFEVTAPAVVQPEGDPVACYASPSHAFRLSAIRALQRPAPRSAGVALLLCSGGRLVARAKAGGAPLELGSGCAAFIPAAAGAWWIEGDGEAWLVDCP